MNTHINEFSKTSELIDAVTNKSVKFPYVANITGRDYVNYDEIDLTQPFTIEIGDVIDYTLKETGNLQNGNIIISLDGNPTSSELANVKLYARKNGGEWYEATYNSNYKSFIISEIYWIDSKRSGKINLNKGDKFEIKGNLNALNSGNTYNIGLTCSVRSQAVNAGGDDFCLYKIYGNIMSLYKMNFDTDFTTPNNIKFTFNPEINPSTGLYFPSPVNSLEDISGLIFPAEYKLNEDLITGFGLYSIDGEQPTLPYFESTPLLLSNSYGYISSGIYISPSFKNMRAYVKDLVNFGNVYIEYDFEKVYIRTDAENIPSSWESSDKLIKD